MLELEAAQQRILASIPLTGAERIPVAAGLGRVLQEDVKAVVSLPGFDNSAMDGYAVRSVDVAKASVDRPVSLRLLGEVPAGCVADKAVTAGTCLRIFTGSPLPCGADAVVMQEDTRPAAEDSSIIHVCDRVAPWENVRLRGEDIEAGAVIGRAGLRLGAAHMGLMAAAGIETMVASRKPVVGLLATGDELREPGQPIGAGQIYESNRTMLGALVGSCGAQPLKLPLVADDLESTHAAVRDAISQCDALVTTGGASVGDHDWVRAAVDAAGGSVAFWKVAIKPGKPFIFGSVAGKPLFGLPGNPVSAFVTFLLFVRPALLRMMGGQGPWFRTVRATLGGELSNRGNRRHFMRVLLDHDGVAWPVALQSSHAIGSLAAANALADVPPGTTLAEGTSVKAMLWD